jgi:hypothetical protein
MPPTESGRGNEGRLSASSDKVIRQHHRTRPSSDKTLDPSGLGFGGFRTTAGTEAMVRKGLIRNISGNDTRIQAIFIGELFPDRSKMSDDSCGPGVICNGFETRWHNPRIASQLGQLTKPRVGKRRPPEALPPYASLVRPPLGPATHLGLTNVMFPKCQPSARRPPMPECLEHDSFRLRRSLPPESS